MQTSPPPLPPRHQALEHETPDEPPPAYTPTPSNQTTLLQAGPQYPFGPTEHPYQHQPTTEYPPQSSSHPYHHTQQPPQHNNALQPSASSSNATLPPALSNPTTVPTPGRPLLYDNKILLYPYNNGTPYFCPKCCNTGFKGFDPYRPCRKCWSKYGKPWSVVRVSSMANSLAWSLQRPLPPTDMVVNPPPLVVQPGDPRIGGRLCLNCNGSGQKQEELTLMNVFLGGGGQEVCHSCRGTGRIFF
ncbi:hypothetical protein PCANC_09722 [Puccinia coronata f. sp. avenae]|uniref:Uncharacterized protein n=1 Tax=Puccinia coronata f. sp. avenae TaxID=200324 RepID=A0A2N5UUD3_9BASI|nr:hypothetical protein PCASD_22591 [Puccinia coronata f. sp. avenae]PLW41363.1 hypothetical protein PCASD_08887 [Puccinia coronata f. sp. avenae]PLW45962.1 hypothetical protein PCANC_09722 [Puccinia coronata f. sp. avenae]